MHTLLQGQKHSLFYIFRPKSGCYADEIGDSAGN
nr:MAG TPA: hypothetical protein [Caudoviricetes sp.]